MPIPLPNLDDRTYADLTADAQALLPTLDPAWTNFNPSDPGITLIELLAWLTEMLFFQVNQITPDSTEKFLKLLNGPDWARPAQVTQQEAIRETVLALRERYRAVTAADYELLALGTWPQTDAARQLSAGSAIRRVRCVPRRDLSATDPAVRAAAAPAHVSLVVVLAPAPPQPGADGADGADASAGPPPLSDELRAALWAFLDERRILTTRHHVVDPEYVPLEVSANLALRADAPPGAALEAAGQALARYFDPLQGGPDQAGWPFGRAVHASEVEAVLQQIWMLDYVENVQLATTQAGRLQTDDAGRGVTVVLDAHELVRLQAASLTAYDVFGKPYQQPQTQARAT
jgi:hypothetical protein